MRLYAQVYKGPNHPHEAQQPEDITSKISVRQRATVYALANKDIDETKVDSNQEAADNMPVAAEPAKAA
jgi:hypothetical protein